MPGSRIRRVCSATLLAALTACGDKPSEPLVPALAEGVFAAGATGTAGASLAMPPAVKVTTSSGKPVPGITVTYTVQSGGGSVVGAAPTTDAQGVATLGGDLAGARIWISRPVVGVAPSYGLIQRP